MNKGGYFANIFIKKIVCFGQSMLIDRFVFLISKILLTTKAKILQAKIFIKKKGKIKLEKQLN